MPGEIFQARLDLVGERFTPDPGDEASLRIRSSHVGKLGFEPGLNVADALLFGDEFPIGLYGGDVIGVRLSGDAGEGVSIAQSASIQTLSVYADTGERIRAREKRARPLADFSSPRRHLSAAREQECTPPRRGGFRFGSSG
jgi:hypothetical protein